MSLFERSAPVETVSDMKCRLYGMLYQMEKFEFFFGLCLSVETLAVTDLLATQLQQKDLSAYEGKELAKKAIITLNALKLEFSKFWEETQEKAENCGVEKPELPRQSRRPARFREFFDASEEKSLSVKDYYEKIYVTAFENVSESLEKRFDQKGLEYYDILQQVFILAAGKKDYQAKLKQIIDFYNNESSQDFDEDMLRTQLKIFSANFPKKEGIVFDDIIEYFTQMKPSCRKMLSELTKMLELVLVLPATNATSERCFSKLKLIKTYLRSRMTQQRLNHYMIFAIYKEYVDKLDIEALAAEFVQRCPRRENTFEIPKHLKTTKAK